MALNFARTTHYRKLDHDSMVIVLPVDPNLEYAEGVPCYWDAAAKVAKPIPAKSGNAAADDAIVAAYCGLAQASSPVTHHMRAGKLLGLTKMAFYIGDVVAKLFMHAGQAIDHFTPVFQGDEVGVSEILPGADARVESLGRVIIDVDEYKQPRTTAEGEEVSTLLRPSIFKTRSF
jgi:hypothetical protein